MTQVRYTEERVWCVYLYMQLNANICCESFAHADSRLCWLSSNILFKYSYYYPNNKKTITKSYILALLFSDGGKPIRSESPTTLFRKSRSLSTPFAHGSVSPCIFYKIPYTNLVPKYHASLPSLNTFIMNMFECGNVCFSYSWISWPQYGLWQNKHYKRECPFKSCCHS